MLGFTVRPHAAVVLVFHVASTTGDSRPDSLVGRDRAERWLVVGFLPVCRLRL